MSYFIEKYILRNWFIIILVAVVILMCATWQYFAYNNAPIVAITNGQMINSGVTLNGGGFLGVEGSELEIRPSFGESTLDVVSPGYCLFNSGTLPVNLDGIVVDGRLVELYAPEGLKSYQDLGIEYRQKDKCNTVPAVVTSTTTITSTMPITAP